MIFLQIYESKGSSSYISMQCGTSVPGRIISPSSSMYIVFSSDGSGQYPGFSGTVRSSTGVYSISHYGDLSGVSTKNDPVGIGC